MKRFSVLVLFIFGCATTTSVSMKEADKMTTMEVCFGVSTGYHYDNLRELEPEAEAILYTSLIKRFPNKLDPSEEVCEGLYYSSLTKKRIEQARQIQNTQQQRNQAIGRALLGISESYRQGNQSQQSY
ncbi:MAG: hypothetical protein ACJ0BD_01805, partial [Gammaproteobacteria bacterium]